MDELLNSWGVSEETIAAFRDNNIDLSCLDGLGEEELKILIPENRLRDRIKFKMGYKNYKAEIETLHYNTDSLDTSDAISLSSCELFADDHKCNNELNLQEILKNSMQGRIALQAVNNKTLDSSTRSNLVQAIVEYYIKTRHKMTKYDFETIATMIVRICPSECKETYYVPSRTIAPKTTMPAKGKLVDRYYNQMRSLRGSGVLPKKHKIGTSDTESTDKDSDDQIADEQREQMQWLKFNRDPWPLVEEKWKATCDYRKKITYEIADNKLSMMINEWPCLKATNGHRLIEIDFIHLYPDKNSMLFEKWQTFQVTAMKLLEAAVADDIMELLKEDNENTRDFAICSSLPFKMKPTSKIYKGENKKINKVSIAESKQAFVANVKNHADIEEELQNRRKSYGKKGLTCQPIVISVGAPTALEAFYVVVEDVKYRFDSLTKALDICFKCFMVLNLAYPKECEQLWLFIQQYFYDIHLKSDKKFSQVSTFIKLLQEQP